ncbi:hypothetical protein [Hymenobacter arcticus]
MRSSLEPSQVILLTTLPLPAKKLLQFHFMNEFPTQPSLQLATVVAVAFLLLGISLLFVGHLFAQLGWHDAFRGTVTGLVVIAAAVLGFLAFCLSKSF